MSSVLIKGLVSVIVPVFNGESSIIKALNSVLNQTYSDIEIIVVDDCSTDNTVQVVKKAIKNSQTAKGITLKELKVNKGVAEARNEGMAIARGEYIAFLDADDYWHEDKTKLQLELFDMQPKAKVVFSSYYRCDSNGGIINQVRVPDLVTYHDLLKGNVIGNLTGVYKRQDLSYIPQKNKKHEDYLMWLEILRQNKLAFSIEKPLAYYTVFSGSLSGNKFKSSLWHYKAILHELKASKRFGVAQCYFSAFFYFCFYIIRAFKKRLRVKV